jgi:hypothetical protein
MWEEEQQRITTEQAIFKEQVGILKKPKCFQVLICKETGSAAIAQLVEHLA